MVNMKTVYVYRNPSADTAPVAEELKNKLKEAGFTVAEEFGPEVEFACVVGGDGTFMHGLRECGFPDIPFVGVNTGHLGQTFSVFPDLSGHLPFELSKVLTYLYFINICFCRVILFFCLKHTLFLLHSSPLCT